ncbi:hypothetical protein BJX62DRAFT_236709 [Aspergillus germanicus]
MKPITCILDLPPDILHNIFSHFGDPRIQPKGFIHFGSPSRKWEELNRPVLHNARLVCRVFHDVASAFAFAIIGVKLERSSLEQLVWFSNSNLGQYVRGIRVGLQYRPEELVSDLDAFRSNRRSILREIHGQCDRCSEGGFERGRFVKNPEQRCILYERIKRWWFECDGDREEGAEATNDNPEREKYQNLLRQSFKEFRRRHEEQLQLITSVEFVTTVASYVTRMPNLVAVAFEDTKGPRADRGQWEKLKDTDYLAEALQDALTWEEIEDLQFEPYREWVVWRVIGEDLQRLGVPQSEDAIYNRAPPSPDTHLDPARILTELPIAVHRAGVVLRDVYIGAFPTRGEFSRLCAGDAGKEREGEWEEDRMASIWSGVQAAYGQLRSVSFRTAYGHRHLRDAHPRASQKLYFDHYLRALMCGPRLESVHINLEAFGIHYFRRHPAGEYPLDSQHRFGDVISQVRLPRVRNLRLSGISASESDLERFCAGIGRGVRNIYLHSIHLTKGSWTKTLDILRDRVERSPSETRPTIELASMAGGEYEALRKRVGSRLRKHTEGDSQELYNDAMDEMVTAYVSGVETTENPFLMPSDDLERVWRAGLRGELPVA